MEMAAKKGLGLDPSSPVLQELYKQAHVETLETPEVQAQMHRLRQEKRRDAKFEELMRGLSAQGNGVNMVNPGNAGSSGSKAGLSDEQMRSMARAMSQDHRSGPEGSRSGEQTQSAAPTGRAAESTRLPSPASKL
mmetsp:Transcript_48893/g.90626  ORF Transcript_48893/g.90626 Transcript_48893/m.90626 type:complete len:135 (+) Transcript_48893:1-405(+)